MEQAGTRNDSLTHIAKALREKTKTVKDFLAAVEKGDTAKAAPFLDEQPALVRLRDSRSMTVLMKASNLTDAERSVQMVRLLLDAGAQATIGAIDSNSMTALMYAARWGHLKTVALLLERPVSAASATTVKDATKEVNALLDAIQTGRLEQDIKNHGPHHAEVQALLSDDALKGVEKSAGQTALMKVSAMADPEKSFEGAELLLKRGAKAVINVLDYEGKSALRHAAERGNLKTCQLLKNHTGSLGAKVALLPPKDIFQVPNLTEMNMTKLGCKKPSLPDICNVGKFFCFDPDSFKERFGEFHLRGETKFRAFANGRSGWIRVFHNYNTLGEDCGCASCGRWDPATLAAKKDWAPGDVILLQPANYWPAGSRIRIRSGSRYAHTHAKESTCATLTSNHYEGAGYREVQFEDGFNYSYEFKDFEPCSEVMPFDVDFGKCSVDADHCVMSPNFPKSYSDEGACSVRVRTPAAPHVVALRVGKGDSLEWQRGAPLNPEATLVRDSVYDLLGVELSGQKHNVTAAGQDLKLSQAPAQMMPWLMPWLHWSPKGGGGTGQGWRICEALIDWRDVNGETAAMKAIDLRSGQGLKVLAHLLEKKASVEGGNKTGQTALMKACDQPDEKLAQEAVGLLIKSSSARPSLQAVDARGRTALIYAVRRCSIGVVKVLLTYSGKHRVELASSVDDDGKGALFHGIEHCSLQMVEVLVEALGGQKEAAAGVLKDSTNKTTIMYAAQRPSVEILAYLIKLYESELAIAPLQTLRVPGAGLALPSAGKLLNLSGLTYEDLVNSRDNESRSALSYAAQAGHLESIRLLKQHGAKMTEVSATGKTVLMYAVESDNSATVKHLLESSDMEQLLDKRDDDNRTALMYAAGSSDETTKILIGKGANISARDAQGMSALMHAAKGGHVSVVNTILKNAPDLHGHHRSVVAGAPRVLLDSQGDELVDMVSWKDKEGATALMYASKINPRDEDRQAIEVIKRLVDAKADVGHRNSCLFSPLMASAQRGYLETVKALLDACDNNTLVINARDGYFGFQRLKKDCSSPLWGMTGVWGEFRTALWLAASEGHKPVVKELITRKADTLLRNRVRMLPIEVAQKFGHTDVVAYLRWTKTSFGEQVSRTLHFKDFWVCLIFSAIFSVACVFLYFLISCLIRCCAKKYDHSGDADREGRQAPTEQPGVCTKRGPILLAARAVRFGQVQQREREQEDGDLGPDGEAPDRERGGPDPRARCCCLCRRTGLTSRRKLTYALNVCANVLMPFGPLMYFTDPDIVVIWWLVLYFVLPVCCSALKACWPRDPPEECSCRECCSWMCSCSSLRSMCRGGIEAGLKLWQFPSLAMTGKYLMYPWILRWFRPRLLIFLVTFTELLMNKRGRRVSSPSAALVFDDDALFHPWTAFGLYTLLLAIISLGAVLWRTDVIPLFADIFTLCWVMFGTDIITPSQQQPILMMLLLPSYPLCLYMVHVYWMGQKDPKVWRRWWEDDFWEYEKELNKLRKRSPGPESEYHRIMSLAKEIDGFVTGDNQQEDNPDEDERRRTERQLAREQAQKMLEERKCVRFWRVWQSSCCDCDRPFNVAERLFFSVLSVYFDVPTIVLLLLADRFAFAFVLLFVCIGSVLLHYLLWLGEVLHRGRALPHPLRCSGICRHLCKQIDRLFNKGVPTVTFLKWIDRAHGFQDFFSLCITLRSLPLIGKQQWVMVLQVTSIAMSTWGLTTFLFEKIELEITELYYDSGWRWLRLVCPE